MSLPQPLTTQPRLIHVRQAIDRIDAGMIWLFAARTRLVRMAAISKRSAGFPLRDASREAEVQARAQRLAARFGASAASTQRLICVVIEDACQQQGMASDLYQCAAPIEVPSMPVPMNPFPLSVSSQPRRRRALRLLPPPRRWAPVLRVLTPHWQCRLLERAMARVLAAPIAAGNLDFMRGRRLGIEVNDLCLRWVIELRDGRLVVDDGDAEASVRGSATDLLLLASRLEDADTLFFQRRLVLTGDTELGLTARNLLERLPWESVPLGLRIALNRGARVARQARAAHRGGP